MNWTSMGARVGIGPDISVGEGLGLGFSSGSNVSEFALSIGSFSSTCLKGVGEGVAGMRRLLSVGEIWKGGCEGEESIERTRDQSMLSMAEIIVIDRIILRFAVMETPSVLHL
jgi:hypothetical protein